MIGDEHDKEWIYREFEPMYFPINSNIRDFKKSKVAINAKWQFNIMGN
jgi:hypothetical protein